MTNAVGGEARGGSRPRAGGVGSRALDVAVSATGLVASSPLLLVVAVAVRSESPGPAIYRTTRLGRDQRPFVLYKFRTMRHGTDDGIGVTSGDDPRVTPLGRWLRLAKVDELPQLFNVLKGDMALVGPRPEDPRYADAYEADQLPIFGVRPGITSPASMAFRYEEALLAGAGADVEGFYRRVVLPRKVAIDLAYLRRRTLATDVGVIVRTIALVATRGRAGGGRDAHPAVAQLQQTDGTRRRDKHAGRGRRA